MLIRTRSGFQVDLVPVAVVEEAAAVSPQEVVPVVERGAARPASRVVPRSSLYVFPCPSFLGYARSQDWIYSHFPT